MNEESNLSENLLEPGERARKQIPIAVFVVIAIHVVLFVGLLGASGCKQKTAGSEGEKFKVGEFSKKPDPAPAVPSNTPAVTKATDPRAEPKDLATETISDPPAPVGTPVKPVPSVKGSKNSKKTVEAMDNSGAADGKVHVVKPGESLFKIAKQYNTTPKMLKASNNLKGDTIRVGQKLRV
jgi:LysM repeat protein